LAPVEPID
jgi:hypothetical protein